MIKTQGEKTPLAGVKPPGLRSGTADRHNAAPPSGPRKLAAWLKPPGRWQQLPAQEE